jgi:hypothetical protein
MPDNTPNTTSGVTPVQIYHAEPEQTSQANEPDTTVDPAALDTTITPIQPEAVEDTDTQLQSEEGTPVPVQPATGFGRPVELASWTSPSRMYDPKSPSWFLGLFAIGLIAIVILAILKEFWLILVVAASIFVYYALAKVEPDVVEHRILTTGIETGGRLYDWVDMLSFWISHNNGVQLLRVDTKLFFPHSLELLLPQDAETEELADLLIQYLPEVEKSPSQAGSVADQAIMSVFQVMPFRDKMLSWWQKRF